MHVLFVYAADCWQPPTPPRQNNTLGSDPFIDDTNCLLSQAVGPTGFCEQTLGSCQMAPLPDVRMDTYPELIAPQPCPSTRYKKRVHFDIQSGKVQKRYTGHKLVQNGEELISAITTAIRSKMALVDDLNRSVTTTTDKIRQVTYEPKFELKLKYEIYAVPDEVDVISDTDSGDKGRQLGAPQLSHKLFSAHKF